MMNFINYKIKKMNVKHKKLILIWLGCGIFLTTILFVIQKKYNSGYEFARGTLSEHAEKRGFRSYEDKLYTYYEITGALTIGGALIISAFGLKEKI